MKRAFDIEADHLTPAELIRKLLTAPVDLLWFGGIGTYVKAPNETQAEVGDRANDALRVNGDEIRAKVIGEGANLAVTQRGRVAFALAGGRIDTDAIDNSAGVDTSDHEVNIKILLDQAIASGALAAEDRQPLLAEMADEVASLVLRDNYLQGEALSAAEARGVVSLDRQLRMIRDLERSGRLDRALEFLPDDETLAARSAQGRGLVRPELAVLLAYAKMTLYEALLASALPDAPELADELRSYFPAGRAATGSPHRSQPIRCTARSSPRSSPTRSSTARGITFVHDMRARTGRSAAEVAQAYMIVREVFELRHLWTEIEALDNKVAAQVQIEMLLEIADLVERAAAWLLYRKRLDVRPRDRQVCAERAQHRCLSIRSAAAKRSQSGLRAQPPFRRSGRARSARNPRSAGQCFSLPRSTSPIWRSARDKNSTEPPGCITRSAPSSRSTRCE